MFKFRSAALIVLSIITGLLFIYSAYTKLYTLESFQSFEFSIIEHLHFPWSLAMVLSRLLTGLELALGILITLHFFGNIKWVLKLAMGLVVIFSVYLVYLWVIAGNNINCGCFGDAIWMSPASSLVKNGLLLIVLTLLIRFHSSNPFRYSHLSSLVLLIALSAVPFFLYAPPDNKPQWLQKDHFKLDLSPLKKTETTNTIAQLGKGKHIIAFMSLGCPHCQTAAYKIHLMKQKNPKLPFYLIVAGKDENWKPFWEKSKAMHISHSRMAADDFTNLVGYSWPVIYWVNNGYVEAQTNYLQMDQGEIERWISNK